MSALKIDKSAPLYIAGHKGMAGSAIWRCLEKNDFTNLVGASSAELDLRNRQAVFNFMRKIRPKYVVLAAAKVGGILANDAWPVSFLSENLQIQVNVMDAALETGVDRLIFLGSSCIYPKEAAQPLKEESLLTGALEPTNDAYAIAKIAGIKHVQAVRKQYGKPWISIMPTNLYGPGDNYTDGESHVLAALIKRFVDARNHNEGSVTNWGTGSPYREFLHVDDLASAVHQVLHHYDDETPINIGSGDEISIGDLSNLIQALVGYSGKVHWDHSKPDGTYRKLLDVQKLQTLGFQPKKGLETGLLEAISEYENL